MFTTYGTLNGGLVLMGNNIACKTVGISSIRIRTHDGIVRTLTEIRHIPNLKKNLISLGTLDTLGYKFSTEDGVMKISKGALIVMKGNKVNDLYVLQGSTVYGSVSVSSSQDVDQEATQL